MRGCIRTAVVRKMQGKPLPQLLSSFCVNNGNKVFVKQGDEYTKGRGYSIHLREKPVVCDAEREGENDRGEKDKGPIARVCAQTHSKTVGLKSPV